MGARVLIVEHDLLRQLSLETLVRLAGHTVCGVLATGEAALVFGPGRRPDVVLMDVRLRGALDGVETAERMRRVCRCGLIFLTAEAEEATMGRMRALEPDAILSKPASADAIVAAVERAATPKDK